MKLVTILAITALTASLSAAAALPPAKPHDHSSDCATTCDQHAHDEQADQCCPSPAPAAPSHAAPHQPVQTIAAPGNKFPMPVKRSARQEQSRAGTIAIRAVQGTPGGEPIRSIPIAIELYHRGTHFDTVEAHLDEHGVALIEDLPVAMGFQPLIKVFYSGVTYQKVGQMMDAARPQQMVEIVCYELTETPPPWTKRMRHVMVSLAPDGIQVTEVIAAHNPTDKTWIGRPGAPGEVTGDNEGKAISTEFLLPREAIQVTLGDGFHEWCCSTLGDDRIMNHIPLVPGTTEMIFAYYLPARRGSVTLEINSLTDVDHLMVIVPDALAMPEYRGVAPSGEDNIGDTAVRFYTGAGIKAGTPVTLHLTGLPASESMAAGTLAKIIAGVGGGVILVIAGILIFARSPQGELPVPVEQEPTASPAPASAAAGTAAKAMSAQ